VTTDDKERNNAFTGKILKVTVGVKPIKAPGLPERLPARCVQVNLRYPDVLWLLSPVNFNHARETMLTSKFYRGALTTHPTY
jgi:hypothetical protein